MATDSGHRFFNARRVDGVVGMAESTTSLSMGYRATLAPLVLLAAVLALSQLTGCRICADCEDRAYPAYGGRWHRTIRDHGRVGSLFEPAGGLADNLAARDTPPTADDLERRRYQRRNQVLDPEELDEDPQRLQDEQDEQRLRERSERLRERDLDEIEVPDEQQQREKQLEEIDIRVIQGGDSPPVL